MRLDEAHPKRGQAVTLSVISALALIAVGVLLRAVGASLWVSLLGAVVIGGLLVLVVMRWFPTRR